MDIKIIKDSIGRKELAEIAREQFGDLVKAVVDVEQEMMAVGGELHADEEALLLESGSRQENLWGINIYPEKLGVDMIEFNSMINVRPSKGNRSRSVEDPNIRSKIAAVVNKLMPL